jgi:amino acid adenylation domain-containing protein
MVQGDDSKSPQASGTPRAREASPLSVQQQRLWFLEQLEHSGAAYHAAALLRIEGPLDYAVLQQSVNALLERHPQLASRIVVEAGQPLQIGGEAGRSCFGPIDTTNLSERDGQGLLEASRSQFEPAFDLERGPLFRVALLQIRPDDHVLAMIAHQIVCDDDSMELAVQDLASFYAAYRKRSKPDLPALRSGYSDYTVRQRQYLESSSFDDDLAFWKTKLEGSAAGLELPADFPRPAEPSFRGNREVFRLPDALIAELRTLSRQETAAPQEIFLTTLVALLRRYCPIDNLLLGLPTNQRDSDIEHIVGLLANSLVLRADVSGDPTFRELLQRVRRSVSEAADHRNLPFGILVEHLHLQRDLSRNPLFQVAFAFRHPPELPAIPGLKLSRYDFPTNTETLDLSVSVSETAAGLETAFSYSSDLFRPATIERMRGHFETMLQEIIRDPNCPISKLPLLSPHEHQLLRSAWNDTDSELPPVTYRDLFEKQVQIKPSAVALVVADQKLTYADLNERANRLAWHLGKLGAKPATLVGIYMDRSAEMLVALLGIMKAGAAYVPLDPAFPRDRLAFIANDAGLQLLVTQRHLTDSLPVQNAQIVVLDADWPMIAQESSQDPPATASPTDLAYVLYTSGSTGQPKGVQIEQRSLVNFLLSMQREPGFRAGDVLLAVTTLSFDIAGLELYLPLATGGTLVIARRDEATDGPTLQGLMRSTATSVMQATPATWRLLLESGWPGDTNLKILCGGEALPRELAEQLIPRSAELWNMYGPTETTIWSSVCPVREANWSMAPIGFPVANTQMHVLDPQNTLLPIGVRGELHIGGAGLARGYWNRPELTAQKFIPDPFSSEPGARLYKTGDLVRRLPDGNIQYLGRTDNQVKVRGFRIELGEIESVLTEHPAIRQAAVIVREDRPGDKQLVAYIIADKEAPPASSELRRFSKEKLPEYMLPSQFVTLEAFPLTPNGKVDRKALSALASAPPEPGQRMAPRDQLESTLVEIFERVLGVQPVGIQDDFFTLGGHSLMAARMIREIHQATGNRIPLSALFQAATVEYLAELLRKSKSTTAELTAMPIQQGDPSTPSFFAIVSPGENALGYALLARHMGKQQTMYRIQGAGPVAIDRPYSASELDRLAEEYVDAMRGVQREGPYYFGGMCDGAHIGLRMARKLEERRERVGMFAIFDTWVLENSQRPVLWLWHYYSERLQGFRKLPLSRKLQVISGFVSRLGNKSLGLPKQRSAWSEAYWPGEQFVPPVIQGEITLFKRAQQPYYYVRDPLMGWGPRAMGGVNIHVLPIDHEEMLREPDVQILGDRLRESILRLSAVDSTLPRNVRSVIDSKEPVGFAQGRNSA